MQFVTQCPVAFTTRIMAGKWKARIVWALTRNEILRFSQLRRACPPISDRVLSRELKELEACGLLSRTEYPVIPPRTEYRLTELGRSLEPVMVTMADWGHKHRTDVIQHIKKSAGSLSPELDVQALPGSANVSESCITSRTVRLESDR